MEVFFADDSSQRGRRPTMGRLVSFGGFLLNEQAIRPLGLAVDGIAKEFGIPPDTEIKWSPARDNWIYSNLVDEARKQCYARLMRALGEFEAEALVVTWAEGHSSLKGDTAFQHCLSYAFERITILLSKQNRNGIVVADRPGGGRREEDQFLASFLNRVRLGTEFVMPERVLLNILTAPSHMIRQLQLADLIVGATTAMVGGLYDYAPLIFDEIRPLFVKNSFALAGGTGLKICPDRLENLYFWILKENKYSLPNSEYFLPLPDSRRFFGSEEFKA
jgi:hypothetical protein